MTLKTIVCIGDSIVEGEGDGARRDGWVGRLREKLAYNGGRESDGWKVYNLGIGGDTIRDIELRLGEVLARQPDLVIIGCCTNDIVEYREGEQWHPKVPQYIRQRSWSRVLCKLKGITGKVLVTPGVVATQDRISDDYRLRLESLNGHIGFISSATAQAGLAFVTVPLELAREDLLSHTLHWNGKGYDAMANLVYKQLQQLNWI